ncbi:MAG: hypothetical protein J5522_06945, partial [Lachnospiraceae bacterium]|nr:hypothetical protein [Lachnospiraceae bacterium]
MKRIKKHIAGFVVAAMAVLCSIGIMVGEEAHAGEPTPSGSGIATWSELQAALNAGGEVTLSQDITASSGDSALIIPSNATVTLDLNGHTIDRGLYRKSESGEVTVDDPQDNGYVIKIEGSLTLEDSSDNADTPEYDGTGMITGGNNTNYGGGVYAEGSFIMNGGMISGNTARYGGGVHLDQCVADIMGGIISGNVASEGGGISVRNSAWLRISDCAISNNSADLGAGVYVDNHSDLYLEGGKISENNATSYGGGVYLCVSMGYKSEIYVSGSVIISGNVRGGSFTSGTLSGGTADNLYLPDGLMVGVTGTLTGSIGITKGTEDGSGDFAYGASGHQLTDADISKFTGDDSRFIPAKDGNTGKLVIIPWLDLSEKFETASSDSGAPTEIKL